MGLASSSADDGLALLPMLTHLPVAGRLGNLSEFQKISSLSQRFGLARREQRLVGAPWSVCWLSELENRRLNYTSGLSSTGENLL